MLLAHFLLHVLLLVQASVVEAARISPLRRCHSTQSLCWANKLEHRVSIPLTTMRSSPLVDAAHCWHRAYFVAKRYDSGLGYSYREWLFMKVIDETNERTISRTTTLRWCD